MGFRVSKLIVRVTKHAVIEPLILGGVGPKPQPGSYHGGWVDDELAALLSLALDIRLRSRRPAR
jgi:hypothetical protein